VQPKLGLAHASLSRRTGRELRNAWYRVEVKASLDTTLGLSRVPGTSRPSESESVADSRAHWCTLLCMRECLCVRVRVRVRACAFVRVRRVCGCRTRYVHASDSACVLAHAPGSAHSNSHTRERTLRSNTNVRLPFAHAYVSHLAHAYVSHLRIGMRLIHLSSALRRCRSFAVSFGPRPSFFNSIWFWRIMAE